MAMYTSPIQQLPPPTTTRTAKPMASPALLPSSTTHFRPRIAIVEDNPINVTVLKRTLLRWMGHAVADSEVFENGAQLLVALGKQKYDLVLMDIEMPVMNGCDATLRIRAGLDQQQRASSSFSSSTMSSSISSTHLATRPPSLSSQNAWCEHYPTPTPSPSPIPSTAVVKVMHQGSTLHRRTRSDSDLSAAMRPPMDYTILKENYNIPIIAVTSLNKESDCHYYLSIGIDEVVGKPVSRPDLFITLIKRFLEEGRRIAGSHHADATEEEKEEGDNGMNVDVVSPSSVLPVLHPPRRPSHAPLHVSSTPLPHQSFPRTTTPTTSISTSTSVSLLNLTSNPRRSPSPFSLRPPRSPTTTSQSAPHDQHSARHRATPPSSPLHSRLETPLRPSSCPPQKYPNNNRSVAMASPPNEVMDTLPYHPPAHPSWQKDEILYESAMNTSPSYVNPLILLASAASSLAAASPDTTPQQLLHHRFFVPTSPSLFSDHTYTGPTPSRSVSVADGWRGESRGMWEDGDR